MKASEKIDKLYKLAGYLKDIECEQCRYEGEPLEDGRCPRCGALGGVTPKDAPGRGRELSKEDKYQKINKLYDEIQNAKSEMYRQTGMFI